VWLNNIIHTLGCPKILGDERFKEEPCKLGWRTKIKIYFNRHHLSFKLKSWSSKTIILLKISLMNLAVYQAKIIKYQSY